MSVQPSGYRKARRWTLDDIPYSDIDHDALRGDEDIFYIVVTASFIEISSDLYTGNLLDFFRADADVSRWLKKHWEPEELQHGHALKAYVQQAWPDFDWQAAYDDFIAEYSRYCTGEELEESRALEMAARCVIEMGTSSYYSAVQASTHEPVLQELAGYIRQDEVRHYKYFYRFFCRYRDQEGQGRLDVLGALRRRLWELRDSDAECAFWHAFHHHRPGFMRDGAECRQAFSSVARRLREHYPGTMAVKMTLKPLDLPPSLQKIIVQPLARATQHWLLR
ncbi:MAG TPA: ferritin-like domain-containing protein [Moraxellaceae bacterium]